MIQPKLHMHGKMRPELYLWSSGMLKVPLGYKLINSEGICYDAGHLSCLFLFPLSLFFICFFFLPGKKKTMHIVPFNIRSHASSTSSHSELNLCWKFTLHVGTLGTMEGNPNIEVKISLQVISSNAKF